MASNKLTLNTQYLTDFIHKDEIDEISKEVEKARALLESKTGPGSDFLGWHDLPENYDHVEFERIKKAAEKIQNQSEAVVIIGIGGSYLGARAVIEFLSHSFSTHLAKVLNIPEIYYAGINLSTQYLKDLIDVLEGKEFSIIVISKSGTTTEPAICFRVLKKILENKYGTRAASERIYAITDKDKGALKKLAIQEGYESFVVPDDVGGRFSVLTAVGLLPIAVSGIDIDELMRGAKEAMADFKLPFSQNICSQYAALRNLLYRKGKHIELIIGYEPRLLSLAEWWKQLYGESEGKKGKGIFPASASFTMDLHSLGQYIQDGERIIFETLVQIESPDSDIVIEPDENNLDKLNYLSGKTVDFVNKKATEGTLLAHVEGGVPNIVLNVPKANPYHLAYLIYFFEKACGISGYVLGVNPFDQPGVEFYKKNMFRLLGKPVG